MAEAANDVTITEEVLVVDSEVTEILVVENEEVLAAEVSDQEKKADSEAKEAQLQEKVVSEVKEAQVQTDLNQVCLSRNLSTASNRNHHENQCLRNNEQDLQL